MTSAQHVSSGSVPANARKQIWIQQLMTWRTEISNNTGVIVRSRDQPRLIMPVWSYVLKGTYYAPIYQMQ